ncbi:hypothetical protein [Endozoicomonas sp. ISHI1]|nr:hypothetical protein [Endozoicomonas sp. ISHI1]
MRQSIRLKAHRKDQQKLIHSQWMGCVWPISNAKCDKGSERQEVF